VAKKKGSDKKKSGDTSKGARKSSKKRSKKDGVPGTCSACKNFRAGKKGGWCARKDNKRAPDAEPCGKYDPR
jgi:hypothetical protein